VVLTGARQTGKTTLARLQYPSRPYLNLDEAELRDQLRDLPTRRWGDVVGDAILDEAQKEPAVFDKVKFAYDSGDPAWSSTSWWAVRRPDGWAWSARCATALTPQTSERCAGWRMRSGRGGAGGCSSTGGLPSS
jgi:hypothetical protein